MNMNSSQNRFCAQCGTELPSQARFCPSCGTAVGKAKPAAPRITVRSAIILLGVTALLWVPAWSYQGWKAGKKPTQTLAEQQQSEAKESQSISPQIAALRDVAQKNQGDLKAQRAYAEALTESLRSNQTPPQELIFEAIEVFGRILQQQPNDGEALIALADISFEQQVFAKAMDYYAKYLSLNPEDNSARARYASSLAFSAKFDEAIKELDRVLKSDPKNFHAAAYKAITFAQMGKREEAIKQGESALALAPSDEAKERFQQFLTEIKTTEGKETKETEEKSAIISSDVPQFVAKIEGLIKENKIAGGKFTGIKMLAADRIQIDFANFPMQAMPPVIRDKFVNGIKDSLKGSPVKSIVFFDSSSSQEIMTAEIE